MPLPPRLFDQLTSFTPALSEAVPDNVIVPVVVVNVAELVGPVIATTGAVVS
jgi:hypothetical protein